jgi:hypothetical protein
MRLLVARIRTDFARTHSYDQSVHIEYDCMQLVLREQWIVQTVMDERDFSLLENSAIKLLLLHLFLGS